MAAPEEFKIDRVLRREEWDGNSGRMVTYELLFENDNQTYKGRVELSSDPLPADGTTVKGWKNEGGKFGFATKGKGSGGSGSGRTGAGGSSEDYDRRPDHPLVMQQRIHTSCLSSAPAFVEQMLTIGVVDQPQDAAAYWLLVERTAARLRATYPEAVLARADGKPAQTSMGNGGDPKPEPEPGPEPVAAASADDEIPF